MSGIAFAVMFPFGSVLLRGLKVKGTVWIHGGWQTLALALAIASLGTGIWLALTTDQMVTANGHAIIGIIVTVMLCFQVS